MNLLSINLDISVNFVLPIALDNLIKELHEFYLSNNNVINQTTNNLWEG
jgi:hypothetical protein